MEKGEGSAKVINGVTVTICSYMGHPDKFADERIPGYYEQSLPDGCHNCQFRRDGHVFEARIVNCGLTADNKGYFSDVDLTGKCKKYTKGDSLFV